jgi:hypothetical protein
VWAFSVYCVVWVLLPTQCSVWTCSYVLTYWLTVCLSNLCWFAKLSSMGLWFPLVCESVIIRTNCVLNFHVCVCCDCCPFWRWSQTSPWYLCKWHSSSTSTVYVFGRGQLFLNFFVSDLNLFGVTKSFLMIWHVSFFRVFLQRVLISFADNPFSMRWRKQPGAWEEWTNTFGRRPMGWFENEGLFYL